MESLCASESNGAMAAQRVLLAMAESAAAEAVLAAGKFLRWLLFVIDSLSSESSILGDGSEVIKGLIGRGKAETVPENMDADDSEDDDNDDEDDDAREDQEDDGGEDDVSGDEVNDEAGDEDADPEANGEEGSDEDEDDEDDEDGEDEDEEDEEEEEEEETHQPPAKKRK